MEGKVNMNYKIVDKSVILISLVHFCRNIFYILNQFMLTAGTLKTNWYYYTSKV